MRLGHVVALLCIIITVAILYGGQLLAGYGFGIIGKWALTFLTNFSIPFLFMFVGGFSTEILDGSDGTAQGGIVTLYVAISMVLGFALSWPLATTGQKYFLADALQYYDQCPSGYMTIEGKCYIWVAEEMTYEDAWDYCGDKQGELVAIESPDASLQLAMNATTTLHHSFWIGMRSQTDSIGQKQWFYPNSMPAFYRPWSDPTSENGFGCVTVLKSGLFGLQDCSAKLPFYCQRSMMPLATEANCWKSLAPSIRPSRWNDDIHWIQFTDPDWRPDTSLVARRDLVAEGSTYTFCVAPIALKTSSPLASKCQGYNAVAMCYATNKLCNNETFASCGWNYPGVGAYARVQRDMSYYQMLADEEMQMYEQAGTSLDVILQRNGKTPPPNGYKRLYLNWLPEKSPYIFSQKAVDLTWSLSVQWIIYGSVWGFITLVVVVLVVLGD
mmetsp:Transcript_94570/g.163340  ORF Transcript_94570/g.163340 Transcript_94570/m.163340 type:complete len:441 (-) Transcript_94570:778-2100(-)